MCPLQCPSFLLTDTPQLPGILQALSKAKVRMPFIPSGLLLVCVPVLPTAALPILVHPAWAIVSLTPCSIPSLTILALPPCFTLFQPMTLLVEALVPLITPLRAIWPLCPFVCIFHRSPLPIILLPPPAQSIAVVENLRPNPKFWCTQNILVEDHFTLKLEGPWPLVFQNLGCPTSVYTRVERALGTKEVWMNEKPT